MPSSNHVVVDTGVLAGTASGIGAAASTAPARPVTIAPCAADATSVGIANALAGMVGGLINATAAANAAASAAADRLAGTADTYERQEKANAQGLGAPGGALAGVAARPGPAAAFVPPAAVAVPIAPGVTPTTGRDIAALIHAGAGPGALQRASALLSSHAEHLDDAARQLRSARWECEGSWDSPAAVAARRHLVGLETTYTDQAEQARALSRHASRQADNFRRAASRIPQPQLFDDLEQRLMAANRANTAPGSMGRFSGVIAHYQTAIAEANTRAVEAFAGYTHGAAPLAAAARPALPGAAGPAAEVSSVPTAGPSGRIDGDVVSAARGENDDVVPIGSLGAWPGAGDGKPELAGLDTAPAGGADLLAMALPTVLGGVAGLAGGLLGALSGAGQKVKEAVQMASGVAQGAAAALGTQATTGETLNAGDFGDSGDGGGAGGWPGASDGGGAGDFGAAGDFGGGGTEPAGGYEGPLSAGPASAATAPGAAPALYSPAAATAAAAEAGVGAPMGGAPMLAPPMTGGASAAGDDRRLYPERKLKVQTPPNSEPVRRRREDRSRARTERDSENT